MIDWNAQRYLTIYNLAEGEWVQYPAGADHPGASPHQQGCHPHPDPGHRGFDIEKGHKKEWYYRKEAKDRNGHVGFSELKDLSWLRASHGGMAAAAAGNDTSHYPRQVPQMHRDV